MGDFGAVDWKTLARFVLELDCVFVRIKGDHRIYSKPGLKRPVVIPMYDPVPPFIIMNNLRVLGVTKEAFLQFLDR